MEEGEGAKESGKARVVIKLVARCNGVLTALSICLSDPQERDEVVVQRKEGCPFGTIDRGLTEVRVLKRHSVGEG